ncbi:MAG: glycosyltransferase involved in cell wall biosynthesis, partial [Bacteroidia bacterium]
MTPEETPFVSILVAARNEQENIGVCLQALDQINYPNDCYEVWIGNDDSEDKTEEIVQKFITDKPNFHLLNITSTIGNAKGKANVLAQLAPNAKG